MCIETLAKNEATKTIELQQKIDSLEDLLNKQSRVLIATVNRSAQFEFAYEVQRSYNFRGNQNSILSELLHEVALHFTCAL